MAAYLGIAGCGMGMDSQREPPGIPSRSPDISGIVTEVQPATSGRGGSILVEEYPAEQNKGGKAWISIEPSTQLLMRGGGELQPAPPLTGLTGARATAWFIGPVAESWPVQATGDFVLFEGPAAKKAE